MNQQRFSWTRCFLTCAVAVGSCASLEAGTIDRSEFCVTDTDLQFVVEVTSVNPFTLDLNLRFFSLGAFTQTPSENFRTNVGRESCEVTRVDPEVQQIDLLPGTDRLKGGLLDQSQYTFTSIGPGQCRIEATIPHGSDPLEPGDVMPQLYFREFSPVLTTFVANVPVTACETSPQPGIFKDGFEDEL